MSNIAKKFFCVRELSQVEAEPVYPAGQTSITLEPKGSDAESSNQEEPETLHFTVAKK